MTGTRTLFHAFAHAFKGGAILGIEEPELFLHPHAQRSLMGQFESLIAEGNQLFISTHSATFLDITRPERIVVVECCGDDEDEVCTQVRTTTAAKLLAERRRLHPDRDITETSMRAFLRNVRTAEMAEPYFARLVVIAEGSSEREALPIRGHQIPAYVIFDNDSGQPQDRAANRVMCRLLDIPETDTPAAQIAATFAVLEGDWEKQMSRHQISSTSRGCKGSAFALPRNQRRAVSIRHRADAPSTPWRLRSASSPTRQSWCEC